MPGTFITAAADFTSRGTRVCHRRTAHGADYVPPRYHYHRCDVYEHLSLEAFDEVLGL